MRHLLSAFLDRLVKEAAVAQVDHPTNVALIFHTFVAYSGNSEASKKAKMIVIECVRKTPNPRETKTVLSQITEIE